MELIALLASLAHSLSPPDRITPSVVRGRLIKGVRQNLGPGICLFGNKLRLPPRTHPSPALPAAPGFSVRFPGSARSLTKVGCAAEWDPCSPPTG